MIEYMLGHKTSLKKLKSIKIIQSILFDQNRSKKNKKLEEFTNILNNTLISKNRLKKKITRETRKYFEMNKKTRTYQNLCDVTKPVLRGIYNCKFLY